MKSALLLTLTISFATNHANAFQNGQWDGRGFTVENGVRIEVEMNVKIQNGTIFTEIHTGDLVAQSEDPYTLDSQGNVQWLTTERRPLGVGFCHENRCTIQATWLVAGKSVYISRQYFVSGNQLFISEALLGNGISKFLHAQLSSIVR